MKDIPSIRKLGSVFGKTIYGMNSKRLYEKKLKFFSNQENAK